MKKTNTIITIIVGTMLVCAPTWADEQVQHEQDTHEQKTQADETPQEVAQGDVANDHRTYEKKDILSAAENLFGKGAAGLSGLIEKIFKEQGRPNGYIAGSEAGAAIVVGLRYGKGTLHHKIEGDRTVYWTGPSVGIDAGGDGSKVFTLVYHLYDTNDLFHRYPSVEGKVYVVGGFTANLLQRKKVVLVPVKLGVGWRVGMNFGYYKFSKKRRILPF